MSNNYQNLNVSELENLVSYHNKLYWDLNKQEISDFEYDILVETLRQKSPDSSILNDLGPSFSEIGVAVKHNQPMLSLDKCYDEENLLKWTNKCNHNDWIMLPKIDGMACSLRYRRGKLYQAATRGNGEIGDDITLNVLNIVPQNISINTDEIEIRGELYMPISVFDTLKDTFSNPRNAVAGIIKRKDDRSDNGIKFLAYDLIGHNMDLMSDKLMQLDSFGFTVPYSKRLNTTITMQLEYNNVLSNRNSFDYEMDGIVFRVNSDKDYYEMGFTSHHPKGAIAYKFQGDYDETYLRNVQWRISRTGCLNPVAIVDPVKLSGAMVTRITLHHAGMIASKNISINSKILAVRRGGVIPHLEKVLEAGDIKVEIPSNCPQCGNTTRLEGDFLYCNSNGECSLAHKIMHFVNTLEIEGLGLTWIEKFIDEDLLTSIPDLFLLDRNDLLKLDNVSDLRTDMWLSQINKCKKIPLSKFIESLGINQLGRKASEVLADNFKTLNKVLNLSIQEIDDIDGFGETTAIAIIEGLKKSEGLINELLKHIKVVNEGERKVIEGKLKGVSFLFTGTLSTMKRVDAENVVSNLGGVMGSGVSKNLNYLVLGNEGKPGSKLEKARSLGVKILTEAEFMEMIQV